MTPQRKRFIEHEDLDSKDDLEVLYSKKRRQSNFGSKKKYINEK